MHQKIIGIVGFIGSGKGTIGEYLVDSHGFTAYSFGSSLKDVLASIFGWPRDLLEGATAESRAWREQSDQWWSTALGRPVTPRWAMQCIGTDVMRNHFFSNIWVASLERKIMNDSGSCVITDVRFRNEIDLIRHMGGELWWVKRDPLPIWFDCARSTPELMPQLWPQIHPSEYLWLNCGPLHVVNNNGTLDELKQNIQSLL